MFEMQALTPRRECSYCTFVLCDKYTGKLLPIGENWLQNLWRTAPGLRRFAEEESSLEFPT